MAVLRRAAEERRVMITKDKGFGVLIFKYHLPHHGVILLRLTDDSTENTIRVLRGSLVAYAREEQPVFLVADENAIRIVDVATPLPP